MKKLFLSLGIISAFAFSSQAQDAASSSEFKPSAGNITIEVNANSPFKGVSDEMFSLNNAALRARYFLSEGLALRLQLAIGGNRIKEDYGATSEYSGSTTGANANSGSGSGVANSIAYEVRSSSTLIAISPGLEIHKNVSQRLSVYYGGYVDFALQTASGKVEGTPNAFSSSTTVTGTNGAQTTVNSSTSASGSYTYEVKGAGFGLLAGYDGPTGTWNPVSNTGMNTPGGVVTLTDGGARGFTRVGLAGVIGADFYITKALYLGVEAGLGLASTSYRKVTTTQSGTSIVTTTTVDGTTGAPSDATPTSFSSTNVQNRDSQFSLNPFVNTSFRLGFWF